MSFTKLRFKQSFWVAEQVKNFMVQNAKKCKTSKKNGKTAKILHKLEKEILCFFYFFAVLHFFAFWTNKVFDLFSTSKWLFEPQLCERYHNFALLNHAWLQIAIIDMSIPILKYIYCLLSSDSLVSHIMMLIACVYSGNTYLVRNTILSQTKWRTTVKAEV